MLNEISNGMAPSQVLRAVLRSNLSMSGRDLSLIFAEQYPDAGGVAVMVIRRWHEVGHRDAISDEDLDAVLSRLLREAGYLP